MKQILVAVASLLVLAGTREANGANACVAAADKGQDLRTAGKLDEARATFQTCARASCNKIVRADCERWIKEIDDARAVEPPPAPAAPPPLPVEEKKESPIRVTLQVAGNPPAAPTAAPIAPVILGGIGVASLAAFGFFQVQGWSRYSSMESGCGATKEGCSDADIGPVRSQFVASGVALGISVVSLGAAAILYFTRGEAASSSRVGITAHGAALSF